MQSPTKGCFLKANRLCSITCISVLMYAIIKDFSVTLKKAALPFSIPWFYPLPQMEYLIHLNTIACIFSYRSVNYGLAERGEQLIGAGCGQELLDASTQRT